MNGSPFFVVGVDRSGTTLLRVILQRHSGVAIPPESHFIPRLWRRRRRYGLRGRVVHTERFLRDLESDERFRKWELPIEDVRHEIANLDTPSFAQALAAPFAVYARKHGKAQWGDKTPRYARSVSLLAGLWPEARFVHMVRDGRDVALSMLDLKRLHETAASPAYFWARLVSRTRKAGSSLGPDRYLEIRYEDLLERPDAELGRLCRFLDIPYEAALLQHDDAALDQIPEKERHRHSRIALPPTKGLRDWRNQMTPSDIVDFEAVAARQLAAFGYEPALLPAGPFERLHAWSAVARFWIMSLLPRIQYRRRRGKRRRAWQQSNPVTDSRR